jgi:hypothetical protein
MKVCCLSKLYYWKMLQVNAELSTNKCAYNFTQNEWKQFGMLQHSVSIYQLSNLYFELLLFSS